MFLDEQTIKTNLEQIVESLTKGDPELAIELIDGLGMHRFDAPISDDSKQRMFRDPAGSFGRDRLDEVSECLSRCRVLAESGQIEAAGVSACEALARWNRGASASVQN